MTEQEFCRCMRTGLPITRQQKFICEGERLMMSNEVQLLDLEDRTSELISSLDQINQDLNSFDVVTRQKLELIRSDYPLRSCPHKLDPRHLESPHILLLGPPNTSPETTSGNQITTSNNPPQSNGTVESLLDADMDEQTNQMLPTPILPSPYKHN
ncbi:unnamed protein product [Echinostoma caproni]|uniref:MADS-box domain-containing protein n=1 Tax=Echinostoma caproni TaxID=27848 RepID=A0A183AWU9_9TREM|nr:unnamed protein product [Echinostoma caproni]